MGALLKMQPEVDRVLSAALIANGRDEFAKCLSLSWPAARRYLWRHRAAVLDAAAARLTSARKDFVTDAHHLDALQTRIREHEIARLISLWAVRYLQNV